MKSFSEILSAVVISVVILGCGGVSDDTNSLKVVAPNYLQGILEKAAQQFSDENGVRVDFIYSNPDSVVSQAKSGLRVDLFIKGNPGWFEILRRDTLLVDGIYSCPFRLSMVLVGRSDGPSADKLDQLQGSDFRRVVIVDPYQALEGELAQKVLNRRRLWKILQPKLIKAVSADHLRSFLITKEADAAIMFESSMQNIEGLVVLQNLDKELDDQLIICGAVTAQSDKKEVAQAFLDLLDSRLCPIYKAGGIYQTIGR